MPSMLDLDTKIFNFINQRCHCKVLDYIMRFFTFIGGWIGSIDICLILMLFVPHVPGTRVLGAIFLAQLITQMIKTVAGRLRPHMALPKVNILKQLMLYDPSFPSAHTATVTAWGTVLAFFLPFTTVSVIINCFMVGLSRIYLGLHYPVDVFVGAFIGIAAGLMVSLI